jgi:peptide/nickel transport system substrate-binding protein
VRHRLRAARAIAVVAALAVVGCGGSDSSSGGSTQQPEQPVGGNGVLVYALPSASARLDPLDAKSTGAQIVSRQIYEPLVATLSGPYGGLTRLRGLALDWTPSRDRTIWGFQLRPGIRFQDGSPLNASAVLANAARWSSLPTGRALLPGVIGTDAPRPNLVRFILRRPAPDFPRLLSAPQLGIVAPAALRPHSGRAARLSSKGKGGSGPFAFRRRGGAQVELTRNQNWWGSPLGLGPALDGVSFAIVASDQQRAGLLRGGQAQAASDLGVATAQRLERDPLLTTVAAGDGRYLGVERSVRGLEPGAVPFSGVWLTRIGRR